MENITFEKIKDLTPNQMRKQFGYETFFYIFSIRESGYNGANY